MDLASRQAALALVSAKLTAALSADVREELAAADRADREEWLRLTGTPMPDYGDWDGWQQAAVAQGLPADRTLDLDFTAAHVWNFLQGRAQREQHERRVAIDTAVAAREAAEALQVPVHVDDEWAQIERGLPVAGRDVLRLLHQRKAHSSDHALQRREMAEALGVEAHDVKNTLAALRGHGQEHRHVLIESSKGGPYGGTWLTPAGMNVAERVMDRSRPHANPRALSVKPDKTG